MDVILTISDEHGRHRDLQVRSRGAVTLAELRPLLPGSPAAALFSDGRLLPPDARLGADGLRTGATLTGGSRRRSPRATSVLQLRVVSGPDCGRTLPLTRGRFTIGRAVEADLTIGDPDISRCHAEVAVEPDGVRIRDLGSVNGTTVDEVGLTGRAVELSPGSLVRMGDSRLMLVAGNQPPAATADGDAGVLLVNRPPRISASPPTAGVEFPAEVASADRPRLQLLAGLLPAVLAVGLALMMRNLQFLAFALLSPLAMVAAGISERFNWRRGRRRDRADFEDAEAAARALLAERVAAETELWHRAHPDAAAVWQMAQAPDCRLWERRPAEPVFLRVRLGIADQPATSAATRAGQPLDPPIITAAPATVDLSDGALGLAGPLPLIRGVARWLVGQLLALHSPRDLTVVALLDVDAEQWRWLRWLPTAAGTLALTPTEQQRVLGELLELARSRRRAIGTMTGRWPGPWTVLLVERTGPVTESEELRALLHDGHLVGITVICLSDDRRRLPAGCRASAVVTSETGSLLELRTVGATPLAGVVVEAVSPAWAEELTRALAPLRDGEDTAATGLPAEVRLADLLDPLEPVGHSVPRRWAHGGDARAPIGVSAGGRFDLDLVRDGPHLLIAGTTGSGKSELLRSLVLGLAARHAPPDLSFVLIDYKGGAAFSECAMLPHTLGLVTDLDGHLTGRVLTSLEAELRSRERAFARAGVSDLAGYQASELAASCPLPRLVLVVDEFATMTEELPGFVPGLIGIAQRGRSLGLHLVLATQRPAGVVSPEIKANISLRIALRVTDPAESSDIISTDAASRISKRLPGRAFVSTADELIEFQTARIGLALRPAEAVTVTELDDWNRAPQSAQPTDGGDDLTALIAAIDAAAANSDRALPAPPWLPPLPATVIADQLAAAGSPFSIPYGLIDNPERQQQYSATHDLLGGGSIGFIGGPRSGRTTALRSFLGQAAAQLDDRRLDLYVIDCAGQNFRPLLELGQCGAVVGRDDPASVARLVDRLAEELAQRQLLLSGHGVGSVAEADRLGIALPAVLVAIDGWEGLTALSDELDAGRTTDALIGLLRDGAAAGITVLVAGDRSTLGLRMGSALASKVMLRLTDRSDYALAGVSPSAVPPRLRPGQAILAETGLEVQLALLDPDPAPAAQWRALVTTAARATGQPHERAKLRVRALPHVVSHAELRDRAGLLDPGHCLLGVGGDDAAPVSCGVFEPYHRFLIAGPARSGRTTAALLIARQARTAGLNIAVAAPARSTLFAWAVEHDVPVAAPGPGGVPFDAGHDAACDLVLVDDSEQFLDTAAGDWVSEMLARHRAAVVATARTDELLVSFRGPAVDIRRHRSGLLLQPGPADGELLGVRTGPHRSKPIAGRGVLVTDATRLRAPAGLPVQVAA